MKIVDGQNLIQYRTERNVLHFKGSKRFLSILVIRCIRPFQRHIFRWILPFFTVIKQLKEQLKCLNFYRNGSTTNMEQNNWSVSDTSKEYLPNNGNIAHFTCQCNPESQYFRGSLSQLLSDPLSTIPMLHLVNSNVTIFVELSGCIKLRLSLDVTQLLFQRATSSTNIDFVLKVMSLCLDSNELTICNYIQQRKQCCG